VKAYEKEIEIPLGQVGLPANLVIPDDAEAIVIFAHGSGSSRLSVRNVSVASYLHQYRLGTLLFDLLTQDEDLDYNNRFDIELLSQRLAGVTTWLEKDAGKNMPIGYFGASTGAAAALKAAARLPGSIHAVVSRGGRPDMATDSLKKVDAPTLLIVGSLDDEVLQLNRKAFDQLNCEKKLEIVTGATHLFEEPGTMDEVMKLATGWFQKYLLKNKQL
jgi:pimeloyl-ACP methyl ester carboxylesterase